MILGFIGTGKISSSIIFGIFKSKLKVKRIYISSRNRNIAKKLTKKFRQVKILKDNQEIINKSSTIILGLTNVLKFKNLKAGSKNSAFINFENPLYFRLKYIALEAALPLISQR